MIKSVFLLVSGNAFSALMQLVRNLLVARLVSVENYGIAATFAITMAVIEMMSQLGLQQLIVQDKDGNNPQLQAGLQGFQALRGVLGAVIQFALAYPLAWFLGVEEIAWAFQAMALVPLTRGFLHFDVFRVQRQMNYVPHVLTMSVPAILSVVVIWPLDRLFNDYRVMLYSILFQAFLTLLMSHLVAQSRYRMIFDRKTMTRGLSFGWPLLVNGLLLFGVFHGEKLVVGRELGVETLALFAMGFTLTLTPTLVLSRAIQSFFLPQLSAAQDDRERFSLLGAATVEVNLLNGLIVCGGVMLLGPPLIRNVLGQAYEGLVPLLVWLTILHAIRVFKTGSSIIALAVGRTDNAMWANLCRVLSIPISWYAAANSHGLMTVIFIATGAEILGYIIGMGLLGGRIGFPLSRIVASSVASFGFLGALAAYGWTVQFAQSPLIAPHWILGLACVMFIISVGVMTSLRRYILSRSVNGF